MPRWPGHRATQSTAIGRHGTSTLAVRPTGDLRRRHTTVGRVASPGGLIIRLIIQTIRRDRSGSVWTDEASNVSRPDPSGADQIDVEHQATDLAVGVRIPRGAPANPQLSGPATGLLALSDSPDCDQTATTSAGTQESTATMCDHNRLSMGRSPGLPQVRADPWHPAAVAQRIKARLVPSVNPAAGFATKPSQRGGARATSRRPYACGVRTPGFNR